MFLSFRPEIGSTGNSMASPANTFLFEPANLVAIVTLSRGRCGLSKGVTWYLLSMAVADLLVVIFNVIPKVIYYYYKPPLCNIINTMSYVSVASSVWLTVAFTFDRTVAICFQRLKTRYCTEKGAAIIIAVVSVLSLFTNIPWYFTYMTYICWVSLGFINSLMWQAFDWGHRVLTPVVPFVLILLLNVVTIRHILMASAARRRLRGQRNGEEKDDQEMKNRRRSIILLFTLSASFILLWMTHVVILAVEYITMQYFEMTPSYVVAQKVGVMLQSFSSCTNMFIYAITQRKFREEMKNVVKYPFRAILSFCRR
ncbi:probable G-protein coupled receptor 139 [Hypanus sabinus]|uniref:probable G-protein coupled receptor 139 n=1 Tax=Hypanus sabinus TaxID=79690 RepID=UPI0028C37E1A|nr:probable G-protein coupled receptor 139 [Hypanus sabinus]